MAKLTPPIQNGDNSPEVYAALDLGSNSFHLLVAKFESGKMVVLDRHKENVKLASGLLGDGTLSKSIVNKALDSLHRFAERLNPIDVNQLRVVGTSTLRSANDASSFLERAESILHSPINIISGSEEARLIYLGVANDLSPGKNRRLVIDIGGASTEMVIGRKGAQRLDSLYMGCVTQSLRFFPDGILSNLAYKKAVLWARSEIQGVLNQFRSSEWDEAVGSSGTIRSIEEVLEGLGLNADHMITLEGLDSLAEELCRFDDMSDVKLPNLSEERRYVFPGGLAILHGLFIELGITQMHVSSFALREGVIFDLAGQKANGDLREDTIARLMKQYHVDEDHVRRLVKFAQSLLTQVKDSFEQPADTLRLLRWALSVHEIGLAISHSGFHKHGSYILLNSFMPGFSKQEQKLLGFLVLNQRRKLRPQPQTYGFEPDWRLVQIVRLACLLCRRRDDSVLGPDIRLQFKADTLVISLPENWMQKNPLAGEELQNEQQYLSQLQLRLDIKTRPNGKR